MISKFPLKLYMGVIRFGEVTEVFVIEIGNGAPKVEAECPRWRPQPPTTVRVESGVQCGATNGPLSCEGEVVGQVQVPG